MEELYSGVADHNYMKEGDSGLAGETSCIPASISGGFVCGVRGDGTVVSML